MYRDDTCAVCGESLPPDHFYCREHAAGVDERLRQIGALLQAVRTDAQRLGRLLSQVAPETWDYLAEQMSDDPAWPPTPRLRIRADADAVTVDVDAEPGCVMLEMSVPLAHLLDALAVDLERDDWRRLAVTAAQVEGANATH